MVSDAKEHSDRGVRCQGAQWPWCQMPRSTVAVVSDAKEHSGCGVRCQLSCIGARVPERKHVDDCRHGMNWQGL